MNLRSSGAVRVLVLALVLMVVLGGGVDEANVVLNVQHKFGGLRSASAGRSILAAIKAHDARRHGRMLSSIEFQLGGNGLPTDTALYYTKLSIGTPPKDYHVQVDTGSDILWVSCVDCDTCPQKSELGLTLAKYDLKASSSGEVLTCDQQFCATVFPAPRSDCMVGSLCEYSVTYGDGSQTLGYFVQDNFQFDQISGDLQTSSINGSISFGCSTKQVGDLDSTQSATDGIIGFGQANSSILSQLASSGKTRRIFSHCLDSENGGGIFAIGQVVQPKVNTTPMVPNQQHYNVILKKIEVDGVAIDVLSDFFDDGGSGIATIIDSGSTLAYLPEDVYDSLMTKVMARQSGLKTHTLQDQYQCFFYSENINDGFPIVSFHFENSAYMNAYPHDYLFQASRENEWCIGWQKKDMETNDGKKLTLLGDIVLSDKLIVYDLENGTIGWTEYDCSSTIKVKDEASGNVYSVMAHKLSSAACTLYSGKVLTFLLLIVMMWNLIK